MDTDRNLLFGVVALQADLLDAVLGAVVTQAVAGFTEKVGPPDRYTFSPTTVQLDKGKSLAIENKTDEDHSLKCTPDAGIGTVKIDKNEMKSAKFSTAGTFTCSSEEHADATVTVTVK